MDEQLSSLMLDRMIYVLMEKEVPELDYIKNRFQIIMDDYKIEPKEKALIVYTEGKNDIYIKRFLMAKAVAGCTKRTIERYNADIRSALTEIGKDADQVTAIDVQAHIARMLARGLSKVTADNVRRSLSTFYAWCYREELIRKNPMTKVDHIKIRKQQKQAFSELEVELIRNATRTNRERALVETLFSTGCRVSELVSIKISDIDGNAIDVIGKGEKHRTVYLNARALLAIQNYLSERCDQNPYLFPKGSSNIRDPEHFGKCRSFGPEWYKDEMFVDPDGHADSSAIGAIVRSIGKRAGVEKCHPHRFRRTCATFALRRGMPLEQVSKMLGHEQLSTTQIYLDLSEKELEQAHAKYVI